MKEVVSKVTIARLQIEKACKLYLNGEYACALTLAGAAESLTHELIISRGNESYDSWHSKFIRFLKEKAGMQSPSNKDTIKDKNWARNSVKHQGCGESADIEIDLEFESFLAIKRSIENYQRLGSVRTECMNTFDKRTREYG